MLKPSLILVLVFAAFFGFLYQDQNNRLQKINDHRKPTPLCLGLLGVLTLVKILLAPCFKGYEVDMGTYTAWMQRAAGGLNGFYADGYFCDYPPLYIMMTGLFGWIRNLFGGGEYVTKLFVKMPGIIAEGLIGYELLRYYCRVYPKSKQIGITVILGILPSFLITGTYWGQTDGIFCYLMLLTFRFLLEDNLTLSAFLFTLSALMKPQSFLFAPLIAILFIKSDSMIFVFRKKQKISRESKRAMKEAMRREAAEERRRKAGYIGVGWKILFTFCSFGIYGLFWLYSLVQQTRLMDGKDNKKLGECLTEFLCLLLIPPYAWYWWRTRGDLIQRRCKALYRIKAPGGFTYVCATLSCFVIFSMIQMQRYLDVLHWGVETETMQTLDSADDEFACSYSSVLNVPKAVKIIWNLVLTFCFSLAIMGIAMMPFRGGKPDLLFLISKYTQTFSSYPYASLNTFNLFGLLGGNMIDINKPFLFLTYAKWGTILMAVCVLGGILAVIFNKNKKNLFLIFGTYLFAIVMLGTKMHERYWYFVPVLFMVHFIISGNRKYFGIASVLTLSYFLNLVFALDYLSGVQDPVNRMVFVVATLVNLAILVYLLWEVFCLIRSQYPKKERKPKTYCETFTAKSAVALLCVILVFGSSAFYRLGSTENTPQSHAKIGAGEQVTFQFNGEVQVSELRYFVGYGLRKYQFRYSGTDISQYLMMSGNQTKSPYVFSWQQEKVGSITASSITLEVLADGSDAVTEWGEMAFYDMNGNLIPYTVLASDGVEVSAFSDEPHTIPQVPSYENSFYFDEIYHGRTSYEYMNDLPIYETTHPPLGKLLMTIGIGFFGWNPFGYRFMGVLFGILMIPCFYQLSRRLFKYNWIALLTTVVFSFDFMRLSHTRIASIDSFMTFFVLAAFTFMVEFYLEYKANGNSKKAKILLGISGAMFGCGAAVKWAAIYAGIGLCALYIYAIVIRYKTKKSSDEIISLLLWSLGLYALIPFLIYYFSYLEYFACFGQSLTFESFWGAQKHMYSYHSGLTATHPYSATWYDWIIDLRPLWMHQGVLLDNGQRETIVTMNNPILVWGGLAGIIYTAVWCVKQKKLPLSAFVIFAGYFSQILPWMFVTRCTFVYHYFPMVAFLALAMGFYWKHFVAEKGKTPWCAVVLCVVAVAMYGVFYPVLTGIPAPQAYVDILKIMPNWTF